MNSLLKESIWRVELVDISPTYYSVLGPMLMHGGLSYGSVYGNIGFKYNIKHASTIYPYSEINKT